MKKWFSLLVIICFVWIFGNIVIHNANVISFLWKNFIQDEASHNILQSGDWNLIVVNPWNEIPDNYSVTLTKLSNGKR